MTKRRKSLERGLAPRRPVKDKRPTTALATYTPPKGVDAKMWDGLMNLAAGLGTGRDKRSHSHYAIPQVLTRFDLENAYRGSWLAGRIVSTVAEDMTREWVNLNWDGYDDDENNVQAIETAEAAFGVRAKVVEALRWARLYGGCLMILGIKGEKDPSKPLELDSVRKGSLQAIHVLDRWWCGASGQIDYNPSSPNFGLPLSYIVASPGENGAVIHWSRVIRFNGRPLPKNLWLQNGFWDDSELQHVIDSVQDYDATKGGIASMVWEANIDIIKASGFTELLSMKDGESKMQARMMAAAMMKSFNRMFIIDKDNEDYTQKTTQFAGVRDILEKFMVDVCGAADIPMTRLFGQSPAGMNSTGESDLRNYYDHVAARQEIALRPQLQRLYEVLIRSTLGTLPKNFRFTFNPLWQTTDKERAEIDKFRMETDTGYLKAGVITEGLNARELKDRGTYRTMEDKDVVLAEELTKKLEEEPPQPAPAPGAPPVPGAPAPKPVPGAEV